ncbi:MAG: 3-isopropylmalate dehydratase small subunit [Desulfurococcales archaeon]|nr:3-isopropylmalate dehydratase small subunit [Desulfurococcales archaeon]
MEGLVVKGLPYILGDDVDTDVIIPAVYLGLKDIKEISRHVLEPIDPDFPAKASRGVVIIAGRNFGMGSSREQAVTALKAAGVKGVVAESFARIFYRNAVNNALPVAECKDATHRIRGNEPVILDLDKGILTQGDTIIQCRIPTGIALDIIRSNGLLELLKSRLAK